MPSVLDKYKLVSIDKLIPAKWNYKKTDDEESEKLMEKLKKNLSKNGQIENLIVRESRKKNTYEVVNGNHRLIALKALKKKNAVCFMLGKISLEDAKRIAVETNETKFDSDPIKLAELITNIAKKFDIDDLVSTLPMSSDDIDNYTKMLHFDWDKLDKVQDEDEEESSKNSDEDDDWQTFTVRLPIAVCELWEAQVDRVKRILNPDAGDLDDVSPVPAIELITAFIDQTPDRELMS